MLFNSFVFIFAFLPVTLFVFYKIGTRGHHRIAVTWLVGASIFFYGWWNPAYVSLILISILFNYGIGVSLASRDNTRHWSGRSLLSLGIAGNLLLLGYFKYANFTVNNLNTVFGFDIHVDQIVLPLAISFFTFQQVAYLVDAHRKETREYSFLHYCLFVTFFPQLIAGPIVHHREMLPQFAKDKIYRLDTERLAVGITIFSIGLFKKVVLADNVSQFSTPVFDAALAGHSIGLFEAWTGALAYTFQLYFDFSGYADMAIGIGQMFGIRLPLNFNSPYKAHNIIEFWRRWHMTLSRFLRDYLYFPLGGNRAGNARRYINLLITMLLGGLWHGAGWTFVAWGGLHGFYLIVNHAWHAVRRGLNIASGEPTKLGTVIARLLTFLAVVVSWVFFRAESFSGAIEILRGMIGFNGFSSAIEFITKTDLFGINWVMGLVPMQLPVQIIIVIAFSTLFTVIWSLPNVQDMMARYQPALGESTLEAEGKGALRWHPNRRWALATAVLALISIMNMQEISEFLYFQF
jgi:D-alanyl-lipoteichoic acid acyltransferase DltB (MBOAT superfamily)